MLKLGSFFRWIPCGRKEDVRDTDTVTSDEEFGPDGFKYKMVEIQQHQTHHHFLLPPEVSRDVNEGNILKKERSLFSSTGCVFLPSYYRLDDIKELVEQVNETLTKHEYDESQKRPGTTSRQMPKTLEKFMRSNVDWSKLTRRIGKLVSTICHRDETNFGPWQLYNDQLYTKHGGDVGHEARIDNVCFVKSSDSGSTFVTVMIAVDDMTAENGCLQVIKGPWDDNVDLIHYKTTNANENLFDSIPSDHVLRSLPWENCTCRSGDIFIFSGWLPNRSGVNKTTHASRAVFLTYKPPNDLSSKDNSEQEGGKNELASDIAASSDVFSSEKIDEDESKL